MKICRVRNNGGKKLRRVLLAILMLIVVSFSYIGFTNMDTDAKPPVEQETESY